MSDDDLQEHDLSFSSQEIIISDDKELSSDEFEIFSSKRNGELLNYKEEKDSILDKSLKLKKDEKNDNNNMLYETSRQVCKEISSEMNQQQREVNEKSVLKVHKTEIKYYNQDALLTQIEGESPFDSVKQKEDEPLQTQNIFQATPEACVNMNNKEKDAAHSIIPATNQKENELLDAQSSLKANHQKCDNAERESLKSSDQALNFDIGRNKCISRVLVFENLNTTGEKARQVSETTFKKINQDIQTDKNGGRVPHFDEAYSTEIHQEYPCDENFDIVTNNVLLSPFLKNNNDDEGQFTTTLPKHTLNMELCSNSVIQDTTKLVVVDTMINFFDDSLSKYYQPNAKNVKDCQNFISTGGATTSSEPNLDLCANNSNVLIESNIPAIKTNKLENLKEYEMILDTETGIFRPNLAQKKNVDNRVTKTNLDQEIVRNVAEDISILQEDPPEKENPVKKKLVKRKVTNTFRKSCIDYLDETENEDFSAGSSNEWSTKESEEESSDDSIKPRKSKKKKKKISKNETNTEAVTFKKKKRENVSNLRKKKKDDGESYVTKKGVTVEAKSLKINPCLDGKCKRSCKNIPEERRISIFKYYWSLSVERRKDWLLRCTQRLSVKRKKTNQDISRRNTTYQYYINDGDGFIQVCQSFLLNTLNITQRQLLYTLSNEYENMAQPDRRHSNVPIKYGEDVVNYAKQFIELLPAVPSHYCRQDSKKVYLPQEFKNVSNLYRLYLEKVKNDLKPEKLSEKMFKKLFTEEYNISFHCPKKDKCIHCTKFQNQENEVTEEEKEKMKEHLEEKRASYARFKLHQNLIDPTTLTTSFDMQKVLNTPHGDSMLLYYSRKYAMYNLTFYESRTQNVDCFIWGESEGKRGSQEIASCLHLYLKDVDERGFKNILLYCDSCCGQNRNKVVIAALNNFLKTSKSLEVIQINFLIPGHTYMPVDSVHAVIENEVRRLIVWSPSQWPTFIEAARKRPKPYRVHLLEHTDFLDFEEVTSVAFTPQIIKAVKFQKVRVVTLKKKCPDEIFVKYSMKETSEVHKFQLKTKCKQNATTKIPRKTRKGKGIGKGRKRVITVLQDNSTIEQNDSTQLKSLYNHRLPISISKYNDLKRLCEKRIIPKRFHIEYLNLPFLSEVTDKLPETDVEDEIDE